MRAGMRFFRDSIDYLTPITILALLFLNAFLLVSAGHAIGVNAVADQGEQNAADMAAQTAQFERMARERR